MGNLKEQFLNLGTWGFTLGTFASNYLTIENTKGTILFVLSVYLLILQIKLHRKKLKKDED